MTCYYCCCCCCCLYSAYFGPSNGSTILTVFSCDGSEREIFDCVHQPFGSGGFCDGDSDGSKAAGVACTSKSNLVKMDYLTF